jgi:group II intron reverse transcriptase/maturase
VIGHYRLKKGQTGETLSSQTVSTELQQLAEQAAAHPAWVFTTLAHHMSVTWLREAYRRVRKSGAAGVDDVSAAEYARDLETNLADLHARLKAGTYRAPPVRRVWLEKADGGRRPLGIPTFEDKIVQRAVAMLLNAIYEQDFYDFSYGFRPGRSAHDAVGAVRAACIRGNIQWIIDADISGCFDNIQHGPLQEIVKERVNDGRIRQLIGKWLHAGVLEGERVSYPEAGTPQGGVISPVLTNIYLHTVLDQWFVEEVQPRLKGRSFLVRYADDFIIGCEREDDARRIMAVLPQRCARYGLTIHPEKSRLIDYRPPGDGEKEHDRSFDFLGFTHYWGRSRWGKWVILRKTARKRQRRAIRRFWQACRKYRHRPLAEQARRLGQQLRGHYQYYAVPGNGRTLHTLYYRVCCSWRYWLRRRGGKHRLTWEEFRQILKRFPLPPPRILHYI